MSSPIFIKIYIRKQRFNRSHINHFKIFIIIFTKTRRTRFYKPISLSTHLSGSFFALINENSHSLERLIKIMLGWNRSKFQRINIKRNSIHVPSQIINLEQFFFNQSIEILLRTHNFFSTILKTSGHLILFSIKVDKGISLGSIETLLLANNFISSSIFPLKTLISSIACTFLLVEDLSVCH